MTPRDFIDFKLYLTRAAAGEGYCQVSLLPTPQVGETTLPVTVPAEHAPDPQLLSDLACKTITLDGLAELGKQLARCLLPGEALRQLFLAAYRQVGEKAGVRLRLMIGDHTLKQLPWEYTYLKLLDGPDSMRGFLLLDPRLSMVRHEPLPLPHPVISPAAEGIADLRLLIAAASPQGLPTLDLEREVKNINQAVQGFDIDGVRISATTLSDATPADLVQAMTVPGSAYILHFAGHGAVEVVPDLFNPGLEKQVGYLLLLADKASRLASRIPAADLARLMQGAGVRLAVIGACHSGARDARYPWDGVAGALTASGIPAVIAMQYEVYDQHMLDFSQMFYYGLASGLSLDEAVGLGRQAMYRLAAESDQAAVEWGVPVLYSRLPAGNIFPERMKRAGTAAEKLRLVVNQIIKTIDESGQVTGITLTGGEGDFKVSQRVDVVKGKLVGATIGSLSGPVDVEQ